MQGVICIRAAGAAILVLAIMIIYGAAPYAPAFSTKKPQVIMRAQTAERRVALTFDASWGADFTPEILKVLKAFDIRASFFLVGYWIERYPDSAVAIAASGHDIENHSLTHPKFDTLTAEEMRVEIVGLNELVRALTDKSPTLFRPPYGRFSTRTAQAAQLEGMECVLWSLDAQDWDTDDAAVVAHRVLNGIRPGDIVLFQLSCSSAGPALELIIPELIKRGYAIITVPELLDKTII